MAAWTWRFETAGGTEVQPAVQPEEFTTQGDAESWIGEYWKDLKEGGTDQVRLFEDATEIYGPMSLHAEEAEAAEAGEAAEAADEPKA
ncbi:hypothetical protein [Streptomyces sp. NPDC057363]|uniref:hypothetical protein n=2 Tax=Streptomyces TaxID=1883 RepID=UPI00362CFA49